MYTWLYILYMQRKPQFIFHLCRCHFVYSPSCYVCSILCYVSFIESRLTRCELIYKIARSVHLISSKEEVVSWLNKPSNGALCRESQNTCLQLIFHIYAENKNCAEQQEGWSFFIQSINNAEWIPINLGPVTLAHFNVLKFPIVP